MFGHDNNAPASGAEGTEPTPDAALTSNDNPQPAGAPDAPTADVTAATDDNLGGYLTDDAPAPAPTPHHGSTAVVAPTEPAANATAAPAAPQASGNPEDLLGIKQQALQQLSPLLGHLDQTPEEKFRTTMMMIQASDNDALIKDAYEAAQQITDEKARAQALLDIVNEINYFTQQHAEA